MSFTRHREIAGNRTRPPVNDMREREAEYTADQQLLEELIDAEGVRRDTRAFLESVRDGGQQYHRPMTEKQRAAVQRVRERLDDQGWA